jgi:hypothetical protein
MARPACLPEPVEEIEADRQDHSQYPEIAKGRGRARPARESGATARAIASQLGLANDPDVITGRRAGRPFREPDAEVGNPLSEISIA